MVSVNYNNSVAKEDLSFGLSLMSHLGEGNVPISPISIRTALSMLYEGAKGDSARQIARTALLPEDKTIRYEEFREISDALKESNSSYTLKFANGFWVDNQYPVNDDFQTTLKNNYMAESKSVNFKENPDGERSRINNWVKEKTQGKIPDILSPGTINSLTVLVLANALYFKADWQNKFNPEFTRKQDYTLSSGKTIKVDMMRKGSIDSRNLPQFLYKEFDGVQLVMLPYKYGSPLIKMVMLPPKKTSVKDLEFYLMDNKTSIQDLNQRLKIEKFERLEIPKHEVRGSYDLISPLSKMGIDRIFSLKTAELSGIADGPLFVGSGKHETYFKTDEEGSEGAAATVFATLRGFTPEEHISFVADRPFLEAVIDGKTGACLFLNRIEDPR